MRQTDGQLLDAIAELWAAVDPAPVDLADGALARLAVDDLETEYELLTLVERVDHASGTRGGPEAATADDTVALEFAGTSYRVLVRVSTVHGQRRLDGWVVPAVPLRVVLGPRTSRSASRARASTPTPTVASSSRPRSPARSGSGSCRRTALLPPGSSPRRSRSERHRRPRKYFPVAVSAPAHLAPQWQRPGC